MMGLQVLYCWGLELSGPISMSLDPWGAGGGSKRPACLEGRAATGPCYRLGR